MSTWKTLGQIAPEELAEARLELHHALQLAAIGVGRHLVPQRDDDSNTSFTWDPDEGRWQGEEIPDSGGVRASLRPADLTLILTRRRDGERRELPLAGKTVDEGAGWLQASLAELGVDARAFSLAAHYEIPDHPVAAGKPFDAALRPHFAELGAYFQNAFLLLQGIARQDPAATTIRTWPHHFDIATTLDLGEVGLSPGDGYYPVPYLFIMPSPAPELDAPPALPGGGEWTSSGWTGAVLQAPRLTELAEGSAQAARAREFLEAAVAAAKRLLEKG